MNPEVGECVDGALSYNWGHIGVPFPRRRWCRVGPLRLPNLESTETVLDGTSTQVLSGWQCDGRRYGTQADRDSGGSGAFVEFNDESNRTIGQSIQFIEMYVRTRGNAIHRQREQMASKGPQTCSITPQQYKSFIKTAVYFRTRQPAQPHTALR
jgi:hypothetical protein